MVAVNLGSGPTELDLSVPGDVKATVVATTGASEFKAESPADLSRVKLKAGEGVVFTWAYQVNQLI